jgi:hypothetical protein
MRVRRLVPLTSGHEPPAPPEPPMAWLCAQDNALALITAGAPGLATASFERRAASDVLALTLMLGGAAAPGRVWSGASGVQELLADDVEWALWCQARLDQPPAGLLAADLEMARSAWRWLEHSRLLPGPNLRIYPSGMALPGIGVSMGVAIARRIADPAERGQ